MLCPSLRRQKQGCFGDLCTTSLTAEVPPPLVPGWHCCSSCPGTPGDRHQCPEELQQLLEVPGLREVSQLISGLSKPQKRGKSSALKSLILPLPGFSTESQALSPGTPSLSQRLRRNPPRAAQCSGLTHTVHTKVLWGRQLSAEHPKGRL